jgi:ABC-type phosphate/phosphonate transport system substrate-binding protein
MHIQFEIMLDFTDFHQHMHAADIVYANPIDSLTLIQQQHFVSLVRPAGVYDEAVFVANQEVANPTLAMLQDKPVASVCSMLPTKIARQMLSKEGINPADFVHCDSWTSVISSVWRNDMAFGIVYKDTYDELSEQGKGMVQVFATSQEQIAFHSLVVGNNALPFADTIKQILLTMPADERGKELLQEMNLSHWVETTQAELDAMRNLAQG